MDPPKRESHLDSVYHAMLVDSICALCDCQTCHFHTNKHPYPKFLSLTTACMPLTAPSCHIMHTTQPEHTVASNSHTHTLSHPNTYQRQQKKISQHTHHPKQKKKGFYTRKKKKSLYYENDRCQDHAYGSSMLRRQALHATHA